MSKVKEEQKNRTTSKTPNHEEDDYGTNENPGCADIVVAVARMYTVALLGIGTGPRSGVADALLADESQYENA